MKTKYKVTAMVPIELSVAGDFDSQEAIKTVKDIFEVFRDDSDYTDLVFNGIEESRRSGNIKYQVETVAQPKPEPRANSDTSSPAFDIVEIFEDYLDKNGIYIVCDDADEERERNENESGAMLYGMEYWHLVEDIEFRVSHMNAQYKPLTASEILKAFDKLLVSKKLGDFVPRGENRFRLHLKVMNCLRSIEEES